MQLPLNLLLVMCLVFTFSCKSKDADDNAECTDDFSAITNDDTIYRQRMRDFVIDISAYAKQSNPTFKIIPQNGQELVTVDGTIQSTAYLAAIDGIGREDVYYGYCDDNQPTSEEGSKYITAFLDIARANNKTILVTDYCSSHSNMDDSFAKNSLKNYVSFQADHRDLNNIPTYPDKPRNENSANITALFQAKNFLYLIDPSAYPDKEAFVYALSQTNYDLLIIDLFVSDQDGNDTALTVQDVSLLKTKKNGGKRLVICYMSIGEAEDYRFYWQTGWKVGNPSWIMQENPDWEGNYIVEYWNSTWQSIIFGNSLAYLDKIINAGFDGVYLDLIDAFEFFETD